MKNLQKGFSILIVIVIIVVVLGVVSVFVHIFQKNTTPVLIQQAKQTQTATQTQPVQNKVLQPKPTLKVIPSKSVILLQS